MDMTGQEQNPAEVTVASNSRRSNVWGHFAHFRTGDGKSKAKCKKCNRVLAAETRNGTSHLRRHVLICCKRLGGSETDRHESNQLTGSTSGHASWTWNSISLLQDRYDQTTLPFGYEMPASSPSFPSNLPPMPQQQPPLLPPPLPLGEPSHPHGLSDCGAFGLETASVGAARPPQPMSPTTRTLSLSLPGSSMQDQDEEIVQKVVSDFEQLCNLSIDKVQNMGAAAICSVEEAAAMNVGAAPMPQQQQITSLSNPAGGGSLDSDSDHGPAGLEEASEHLAPRPYTLSVSEEPSLEVAEEAHHGPGLEKDEASRHLARMIALHGYDSSIVEDDHFRSFVRSLNPEFEVPSRIVVENMCDGIFDEARRNLLNRLRSAPGKVSVAVGRAKTMEEQVLYVACHFIDDGWNLHKLLLHAIVTTDHHDNHDGAILGLEVSTYATNEDVVDAIANLGSYNDKRLFMVAYEKTNKKIHATMKDYYSFVAGLHCTDPGRKEKLFNTYVDNTYMDNVLHSIARCLLPNKFFTLQVFRGLKDLLLTRQERLELLAKLDLHYEWACNQQWYAVYCSLQILYKKGFPGQLTDAELAITKLLCNVWQKIFRAIQKNSSSSTHPTANLCLAELFKLREILQHELAQFNTEDYGGDYDLFDDDKDFTFVLREASDTLDKAIQDSYLAWSLPLALDPRSKLKFITFNFERVYGIEAAKVYISRVTTMMTQLYADYVKEYGTIHSADHSDGASSARDITTSADDPLGQAWNEHCRSQEGMTELDRYLKDPLAPHHPQAEGFDILNWWKIHSSEYPMVARMARDALAMPTCSKLSSDQMVQLRSILRGYSNQPYGTEPFLLEDDEEEVQYFVAPRDQWRI